MAYPRAAESEPEVDDADRPSLCYSSRLNELLSSLIRRTVIPS